MKIKNIKMNYLKREYIGHIVDTTTSILYICMLARIYNYLVI